MEKKKRRRLLGEILVQKRVINKKQLEKALNEQKKTGQRIGYCLLSLGFIQEKELIEALGKQLNIACIDLATYELKPDIVQLIPEDIARRYELIALKKDQSNTSLTIAMVDPLNVFAIDEVQRLAKCNRVEPTVCAPSTINPALDAGYLIKAKQKIRIERLKVLLSEALRILDELQA